MVTTTITITVTDSITAIELALLEGRCTATEATEVVLKKEEYLCSSEHCRNNFYCKKCSFARNLDSLVELLRQYGIIL